jgi:hypothetical protein
VSCCWRADPAGNVSNNWNDLEAANAENPIPRTSTWGAGSGVTVIYGVPGPVKTPLMGTHRQEELSEVSKATVDAALKARRVKALLSAMWGYNPPETAICSLPG